MCYNIMFDGDSFDFWEYIGEIGVVVPHYFADVFWVIYFGELVIVVDHFGDDNFNLFD